MAAAINPFTDTPAKMVTAESSLSVATYPMCISTLDYAGGSILKTNRILEIYNKQGRLVWKRGTPRLTKQIEIETLHFHFRDDILGLKKIKATITRSEFLYSFSNFRRPGQGIGEPVATVNPTSLEIEQRIDHPANVVKATRIAVKKAEIAADASAELARIQSIQAGTSSENNAEDTVPASTAPAATAPADTAATAAAATAPATTQNAPNTSSLAAQKQTGGYYTRSINKANRKNKSRRYTP